MNRLPDSLIALALATALAPALVNCGGGGSGGSAGGAGTGTLAVFVTDAPIDPELVTSATIGVDKITIHRTGDDGDDDFDDDDGKTPNPLDFSGGDDDEDDADEEDGDNGNHGWITLYDGAPISFDLLELRNGVQRLLAISDLPAGTYRRIRLHLTSAELVLVNGNEYSTADGDLHTPSAFHSGLKVWINPPIEVHKDQNCSVLLDFDLSRSFLPIPANDPLSASRYLLLPVLRGANMGMCGKVSGTVVRNGAAGEEPVGMATVHVLAPGETSLDDAIATTISEADGTWTVLGLTFGSYDLVAVKDAEMGRVNGVSVQEDVTTPPVEILIE